MLKEFSRYVSLLAFVMMLSCQDKMTDDENAKPYYDVKGFIENQIVYLNEKKPDVLKTTVLDNKKESVNSKEIDWKKELELFVQADINKPSYRQNYNVIRKDSMHFEYKLKPNVDLPVRYLKILTDSLTGQPVQIEALLKSQNRIYQSEKEIQLKSAKKDNLWQLASYSVKGYQKLIFMDKRAFTISAKIGL